MLSVRVITSGQTNAWSRSSLHTRFLLARSAKFPAEITRLSCKSKQISLFTLQSRCPPCYQLSFPAVRWLGTTHELNKKDEAKDVTHTGKLLAPGDKMADKDGIGKTGTSDKKPLIVSPPTVQVFADPNMAQTVRDVSVDIEKVKGQLKFLREEFSESSFEVLKLAQGRSSIVAALKETRKFSRDNQSAIAALKTEQSKLDQLIVYISKMLARHENQLNDLKKGQDKDAIVKKIDSISQRIDQANGSIQNLTAVHDKLQADVKKALADVKQLHNDVNRLELEVKYRGREITELKCKSPMDQSKQLNQKPPK